MLRSAAFFAACIVPTLVFAASDAKILHAPKLFAPGWKFSHSLATKEHAQEPLTFTLVLQSADIDGLTERMTAISKEGQGRWLSIGELTKYAGPTPRAKEAVMSHLKTHGIQDDEISVNAIGDHISVKTTVAKGAALFNTTFDAYKYGRHTVPRTLSYSLSSEIASHVLTVQPIASFGNVRSPLRQASSGKEDGDDGDINSAMGRRGLSSSRCIYRAATPACIASHYKMDQFTPKAGTATIGVGGFLGEYFNQTDLDTYLSLFRPDISSYTVKVVEVVRGKDGRNNASDPGGEAMLDVEMVASLVHPLSTTFYSVADEPAFPDTFLAFFEYLVNDKYRPGTVTISYSGDEKFRTVEDIAAGCRKVQMLAALGTTVLISSGDDGPGGIRSERGCLPFAPQYPASCPFALAVGATYVPLTEDQNSGPESSIDINHQNFVSGSGFSNNVAGLSYQQEQVAEYLERVGNINQGLYSATGRAYPDLSAMGSAFYTVYNGTRVRYVGTSVSAPLVAAMIGLINSKRSSSGKGPLGWAHPLLYGSKSNLFNDVTKGGSYCPGTQLGWPATEGYDLASGLGSPNFPKLLSALG